MAYYRGFNVSDIERIIAEVQATVASISGTLNGIMPNENITESIETSLMEVSIIYTLVFDGISYDECISLSRLTWPIVNLLPKWKKSGTV